MDLTLRVLFHRFQIILGRIRTRGEGGKGRRGEGGKGEGEGGRGEGRTGGRGKRGTGNGKRETENGKRERELELEIGTDNWNGKLEREMGN